MNENITTTQKYEKYNHNAKIWKIPKNMKNIGQGREVGKNPWLPDLPDPWSDSKLQKMATLTPFLCYWLDFSEDMTLYDQTKMTELEHIQLLYKEALLAKIGKIDGSPMVC